MELKQYAPEEIEKKSFEIIEAELNRKLDKEQEPVIKRVIHTTADFSYAENLCFSGQAIKRAKEALKNGACIVMEKAAKLHKKCIYAIGNAPTALIRLYELIQEKSVQPELVIGVPVGFVNVVEAKELILKTEVPYIVARGRKGGSNVAAAICNALLYEI